MKNSIGFVIKIGSVLGWLYIFLNMPKNEGNIIGMIILAMVIGILVFNWDPTTGFKKK
ncbi:MAG: hypothetical protein MRY23_00010 [Pelagibacteraceae bacterium]|nr:hypothetical protein [Pelagibacteraceae bacterium]MCI5080034.1 hypothetical protein [Pelagibacteraceae bacterium]